MDDIKTPEMEEAPHHEEEAHEHEYEEKEERGYKYNVCKKCGDSKLLGHI